MSISASVIACTPRSGVVLQSWNLPRGAHGPRRHVTQMPLRLLLQFACQTVQLLAEQLESARNPGLGTLK